MTELRNYKDKNFSVAINTRMKGIEITFNKLMTNEMLAEIKEAGFKWSKRQQKWWAYQNESSIAFTNGLTEMADNDETERLPDEEEIDGDDLYKVADDIVCGRVTDKAALDERMETLMPRTQETENPGKETTVNELAELIRRRAELDRKIKAMKETLDEQERKAEKPASNEQNSRKEKTAEIVAERADKNQAEMSKEISPEETAEEEKAENKQNSKPTAEELEAAKKLIPSAQYAMMLDLSAHGEESEFFRGKIQEVARMAETLSANRDGKSYNAETERHDKGYIHYFAGGSDWYICELGETWTDENGKKHIDENAAFGYAILNGDTETSEYGKIDLNEITTLNIQGFVQTEIDLYTDQSLSMEQAICKNYPELKARLLGETKRKNSTVEEIEQQASEENIMPETALENSAQSEMEEFNRKTMFLDERHTPNQTRLIREHCKEILDGHTDEEIRANSEFLNILAQYEGGGGIAGEDGRTSSEVLNAFYTPRNVIDAVWKIAEHYAPNTVYSKWRKDISDLFPNVKINDLYNLNKESTERFRDKENPHKLVIPENSVSLVTYEALKNVTFTDYSCEHELKEDFSKLLSEDFDGTATQNAQNAEKIKNVIGSASQVKNTNFVFYEECGWDNITVDEAHNFKNLWTVPRPKNKGESNEFAGIPSGKPSTRALKLYGMTQLTQRHNEDRNVFLLTATPFTNSPLEVYSMLSYVGRARLIKSGLYSLRDFCNQFAHTKLELGVNSKGEIDQKQVMKNWKELPALQKLLTEYIDKVDGEELKEIIRPRKFSHVQELEMSDLQKKMMEQDIESMSEVKEGNSAAIITAMNAMRLSLVAPALADPSRYEGLTLPSRQELVETSPKLKFVCDSVFEMYKNNPEKGQFIYMPLGKEAHGIVKDYLVAHGVSKDSVEIINGEINNSTEKKYKVTSRFNNPKDKCKILIGGKNTSEGIDLNGNSFVMYNCSLGWNPSETIQAEGRIWRQGNRQGHVHCCYPVMNDSIDSVLYQKHDEKRSRINELWTYKENDSLNVEDINPEELKFELLKDPKKRAKFILENGIEERDKNGKITFKFEGTIILKNELAKIESRLKSFDEVYEKRMKLRKNLREAEFDIQKKERNFDEYKSRNLEIPGWLKSEIKDSRKYKSNYEHQLETISRKFVSWGIRTKEDLEKFIPNMNEKKRSLERQLAEKQRELPKLLERETIKMNEIKVFLPPVEQQMKDLTKDIQENLRPMKIVEGEIRTERFEEMLSKKWERGEITSEEREKYSSAGYKKYYEWLDSENESLEPFAQKTEQKAKSEQTVKKTEEKTIDAAFLSAPKKPEQNFLFDMEELDALSRTKTENAVGQKVVHQLITYTSDNGIDEKFEYKSLSEVQKTGRKWFKEWNLDKTDSGFVIFNRETKKIESSYGHFPLEQAFSNDVLKSNGLQVRKNTAEAKISDVANFAKEKNSERTENSKHTEFVSPVFAARKQKMVASIER